MFEVEEALVYIYFVNLYLIKMLIDLIATTPSYIQGMC